MKFCKNLQKVADLSNPEWSPYWTDYKKLKKIIKRLSDLDVGESLKQPKSEVFSSEQPRSDNAVDSVPSSPNVSRSQTGSVSVRKRRKQGQGDRTAEASPPSIQAVASSESQSSSKPETQKSSSPQQEHHNDVHQNTNIETIKRHPGEILFFKILHSEFQKAVHFFDRIIDEFTIREERVVEGMQIVKRENRFHLWNMLAKSIYRFYTDLLLLETFCIMTYCSFSKILKKHDKVTGFDTRNAFMSNVVNKANFTNYTHLQEMIGRCEQLYVEVSNRIVEEGQQDLYEDERLFIEMVHQLNQQV